MIYKKLLMVEDDSISVITLKSIIKDLHFEEIIVCDSGEKALEILKTNRVDIVSMDIELAGELDGIETAKQILKDYDLPIIFVTSHKDEEILKKVRSISVYGYVSKPFRAAEVKANIELSIYKHKSEIESKHNQLRLKMAAEVAKLAIWEYDCFTKKVLISDEITKIFGYSKDDIGTFSEFWKRIVIPKDFDKVHVQVQKLLKGEISEFNEFYRMYHKDGEIVWVQNKIKIIERDNFGQIKILYGVLLDISEQLALEEEIVKSEARFQAIIQDQTELICRFTPDGKILFMNTALANSLSETHSGEFTNIFELFSRNGENTFKEHLESLTKENPVSSREYQVISQGKLYNWQMWNNRAIFDDFGNIIEYQSVGRDITNEKKAEIALKLSEEQYRSVVNHQTEIIFRFGLDGAILFANQQFLTLFKTTMLDIIGINIKKVFSTNSISDVLSEFLNNSKSNEMKAVSEHNFDQGVTIIQWEFSPIHDEYGILIEYQAVGRDVTSQKIAEKQLYRLSKAIEQSDESVVITDKKGIIQYVNPAHEKISGYSTEEIIGKSTSIVSSNKHNKAFYTDLWNKISSGYNWKGRFVNKAKDGHLYEEMATISPVIDENQNIANYVAVKRDLSEQLALEKQLRQAQKMEAIGTLAGGIAHDFNNLLAIIIGYAELVIEEVEGSTEINKDLTEILKAGERARELVKQILTFSRQSETVVSPIALSPILKEALKMLRSSIPSTIIINKHIDATSFVKADSTQIHQIIMNLCTNSYHAMKEKGGTLTVELDDITFDEIPQIYQKELSGEFFNRLRIIDSGDGIPHEKLDRIFDPYFTTKKQGEGTGLGLAIVHGIIRKYHGHIAVQSEVGVGTTFEIFLPSQISVCESLVSDVKKSKQSTNAKILFVDDEEQITHLTYKSLSKKGYDIEVFTSSVKALERFESEEKKFDIIITDQTMPHLTGINLSKKVRLIDKRIPIILCTGYSKDILENNEFQNLVNKVLSKPINQNDLMIAIEEELSKVPQE